MRLSFEIALRFLKSNKGQTILIALGIAIGVSVQIFIGLLIQGLQTSLINKTIGNSPQITITSNSDDKRIKDWEAELEKAAATDNRIKSVSPAADISAFLKNQDKAEPVLLRGFVIDKANTIYNFKDNIFDGRLPDRDGEVIVGKELKEKLALTKDQVVDVVAADGKKISIKIVGFYDLKVSSINEKWIISELATSQALAGYDNDITSIEMQVKEIFKADEIANVIKDKLGNQSVKVADWKSQNQQLLSGLSGQSISSIMIQIFVLVSVVLAIASVLAISVMMKSKQIGILKAMGLKDRDTSLVFMFEGLLLGILGAAAGLILGAALLLMFTKFAVNPDGTPVVEIYFNYGFIAASGGIAILSAVIASLIPARRSSKMNPIEVIKNG